MNCEILAVGSEMLTPFRQDTNSLYLTERLNALGVTSCCKSHHRGQSHASPPRRFAILARADISSSPAASARPKTTSRAKPLRSRSASKLVRDPDILTSLYKRFAERRIPMPPQ